VSYEVDADITRASTLPGRFYSDPVAFGVMRERVFARSWQFLGDVSYSLYLIHPLVFGVGYKLIGALQPLPLWTQEPIRWAAIAVCCAVSYATWRLIEIPMIRIGEALAERRNEEVVETSA